MKYLKNKPIDYNQDPNNVHMFEVSWFVELMNIYNGILSDVILSSAKKGDIIRIHNDFLPKLMGMIRKTSQKEKITDDMKSYVSDRVSFRLNETIDELRNNGYSDYDTNFITREINNIQTLLNNERNYN